MAAGKYGPGHNRERRRPENMARAIIAKDGGRKIWPGPGSRHHLSTALLFTPVARDIKNLERSCSPMARTINPITLHWAQLARGPAGEKRSRRSPHWRPARLSQAPSEVADLCRSGTAPAEHGAQRTRLGTSQHRRALETSSPAATADRPRTSIEPPRPRAPPAGGPTPFAARKGPAVNRTR